MTRVGWPNGAVGEVYPVGHPESWPPAPEGWDGDHDRDFRTAKPRKQTRWVRRRAAVEERRRRRRRRGARR